MHIERSIHHGHFACMSSSLVVYTTGQHTPHEAGSVDCQSSSHSLVSEHMIHVLSTYCHHKAQDKGDQYSSFVAGSNALTRFLIQNANYRDS